MHAYVLAGDPDYLAASIQSYYPLVDRIVLSADAAGLSWSGRPLDVDLCLSQARAADPDGKLVVERGPFADPGCPAMDCETRQRQAALDAASDGCDWVVQLDNDEVVPDLDAFRTQLLAAESMGATGLDFPSRWLYAELPNRQFLETSDRWWRTVSSYPGSLAARAGTRLAHARQVSGPLYRVDIRRRNTDPYRAPGAAVDAVVPPDARVMHFSWTRPLEVMRRKAAISGHAGDYDWPARIEVWQRRQAKPLWGVAATPFRRRGEQHWLRRATLPVPTPPRRV